MRVKVNKEATATATEDGPHELTNITVKEVSVVDRAANRKRFLVVKNEKNAKTEAALKFLANRGGARGDDLASQLDAKDAASVEKSEAQKILDAKDAADAAELKALKAGTPAPVVASAPVAAPAVAPVVTPTDALKAVDALAATVTPAAVAAPTSAKKDDLPVAVVVVPEAAPLSESAEKLKTAILAGIDLIASKVVEWRKAVEAADKNNTDLSGRPYCTWEYSYYLTRMINNLSDIGGPEWDVLNATIGKEDVTKAGNKAITAARVGVLKGVHEALQHCTGSMSKVMKELAEETPAPDAVTEADGSSSFAKAAPVAQAVPAPAVIPPVMVPAAVVATDPAILERLTKSEEAVKKSEEATNALLAIVQAQAADIAKARGEVSSNVISDDSEKIAKSKLDSDNLKWSDTEDLAPRRSYLGRRSA